MIKNPPPLGLEAPHGGSVFTLAKDMASKWCIYQHHAIWPTQLTPVLIHIGVCRLVDVYTLHESRRNSRWLQIVTDDCTVAVTILYIGAIDPCHREFHNIIGEHRHNGTIPTCNALGYKIHSLKRAVICVTTGKEYESQTEAARMNGIAQGHMSRHLAGKLHTCKKMVFRYKDGTLDE